MNLDTLKEVLHPGVILVASFVLIIAFFLPQYSYIEDYNEFQYEANMPAFLCEENGPLVECENDIVLNKSETALQIDHANDKYEYRIPEGKLICLEDTQIFQDSQWLCLK
jgi:hypothetical protein